MNNRGELIWPTVIFLTLTALFLLLLGAFVYASSTGGIIYEQIYAKKIAVAIDSAKPGTELFFDVSKGNEIAKIEKSEPTFLIDNSQGFVYVSLVGNLGYRQKFLLKL
jgi:hypothetical protein